MILSSPGYKNPGAILGASFLGLFALGWLSFVAFWTVGVMHAPFPINVPFLLFSLPFWAVGVGMAGSVLMSLFGRVRLLLTPQGIEQTAELFGCCRKLVPTSPLKEVDRIELQASYTTRDSDGDKVTMLPVLIVWAGVRKYEIKKGFANLQISSREIEWLASELSAWLNLPIEQTNNRD